MEYYIHHYHDKSNAMKNEDNRKNYRRQKLENRKKGHKDPLDDDMFYQRKLNKQFKQKKKSMFEEQEDWKNWDSDEL